MGSEDRSGRKGRLMRVALITFVALVVLAGVFAFIISNNGASASTKSQASEAFSRHLANFASENATLLVRDYAPNATLRWTGATRGLGGIYDTSVPISQFYSTFFSKVTSVSVKNSSVVAQVTGGGATVNGTFSLLGGGPQVQAISGQVTASVSYINVNGAWIITSETWDFLSLNLQRPLA